jgi:Glycosyltransferase family 87
VKFPDRLSENLVNYNIVRIAFLPAIVGVMLQGQTGFLTATLVGLFCFGVIAERTQAGIPLGLMIIKPHLALGIAFFCLIEKKWGVICVAGITSAVLVLIATFWFGANVWESFAIGIAEIGRRLADGDLPLAKMTSVYASLSSAGVSHTIASSLQILSFLICLSVIFWAHCLKLETKMLMGISIFCSLGLAPYVFYYDWTILAVGFALLLPALSEVTNLAQRMLLISLLWVATGWGQFQAILQSMYKWAPNTSLPSGAAFLLTLMLVVGFLRRKEKDVSPGG